MHRDASGVLFLKIWNFYFAKGYMDSSPKKVKNKIEKIDTRKMYENLSAILKTLDF